MSDEDLNLDDGDIGGMSTPKKSGSSFLPTLLKWIAIVVGAIILIVTVVIITNVIMHKNEPPVTPIANAEEYVSKREVLDWYSSIGSIRTKTKDPLPASVIVEVVLGYKTQDKVTSTEITQRQIEIKDFLRRYFTGKSSVELGHENEDALRIEIRNAINDDILSSSKIRDVRFLTLDIIEQ